MADQVDTGATDTTDTDAGTVDTKDVTTGGDNQVNQDGKGADTLLTTDDSTERDAAAPADWPEDWREKLSGGDDKALARLKRFTSPANVFKSFRALEQKMSSGELKSGLSKDAKPEEIAAWRKENGIPEKPEGYFEALPDGLVIGDDDKPLIGAFAERMHGKNVSPEIVHDAIAWWNEQREQQIVERQEKDAEIKALAEDELRAELGAEYRRTINQINGLLETAPEGVKNKIMNARCGDGTPLASDPDTLRFLAQMAREINPVGTVVPGSGANQIESIESEIATIEKTMRDDAESYWKDDKMQSRYTELLSARTKLKSRAA